MQKTLFPCQNCPGKMVKNVLEILEMSWNSSWEKEWPPCFIAASLMRMISVLCNALIMFSLGTTPAAFNKDAVEAAPVLKCETVSVTANKTLFCPQNLVFGHFPTVLGWLPRFDFVLILVSSGQVAYPHLIG